MVSQQSTHNGKSSTDWSRESDDSVRITAEQRRLTLITFLREELTRQQVIADNECRDLNNLRKLKLPLVQAERRASTAIAIAQYLGSTLRAIGGNRDFAEATK